MHAHQHNEVEFAKLDLNQSHLVEPLWVHQSGPMIPRLRNAMIANVTSQSSGESITAGVDFELSQYIRNAAVEARQTGTH